MNIWFILVLDTCGDDIFEMYISKSNMFNITDLEMAIAYWNLVLNGRFKFLDLWNKFLLVSLNLYINDCSNFKAWKINMFKLLSR